MCGIFDRPDCGNGKKTKKKQSFLRLEKYCFN